MTMNDMKDLLHGFLKVDWRVLVAVPVLSVFLGIANLLRLPEDMHVAWSDTPQPEPAAESSQARSGEWTSNFAAATNAAETAHLPVVVVVGQKGCGYCARLRTALKGAAVADWMKERNWYFVLTERERSPEAADFAATTPAVNDVAPYVYVRWTRPDGTRTERNFPGRYGSMGVPREGILSLEWMRAVERDLQDAPGVKNGISVDSIVKTAKVPVSAVAELEGGAKGRVSMSPKVSFLKEGQKVKLKAIPGKGSVLSGWRLPDGRVLRGRSSLSLGAHSSAGRYAALFRRAEDCAPPVLSLPGEEVVWESFRSQSLSLTVNDDAYPVKFMCSGLPPGMYLPSRERGMIVGRPTSNGVWRVEVSAYGPSRGRPPAKGHFTIRVIEGAVEQNDADEEDEHDETEEEDRDAGR